MEKENLIKNTINETTFILLKDMQKNIIYLNQIFKQNNKKNKFHDYMNLKYFFAGMMLESKYRDYYKQVLAEEDRA